MISARTPLGWMLNGMAAAALVLPGVALAAPKPAAHTGAVGPRLTVVHQFGDDFPLVGIGVRIGNISDADGDVRGLISLSVEGGRG